MKNQFKKSLSLIMAVIMLMSCWVWVAPNNAKAYMDVTYSMTITYDVVNTVENGGHINVYYYPFNDNGSLSSTKTKWDDPNGALTSMFHEGNGSYGCTVTVEVPGWPCGIFWQANGKGANNYEVGVKKIQIGTQTVLTCNNTYKDDVGTSYDNTRNFEWNWDGSGASDGEVASRNWSKPAASSITSITAVDVGTIGLLPSGASVTGTSTINGVRDQYGVVLPSYYNTSITSGVTYSIKDGEGKAVSSDYATVSGSGSTATVTVKPAAQTYSGIAGNANGTFYLYAKYGTEVNANIKFKNPSYTITFDGNGGKIGLTDDEALDQIKVTKNDKLYYNTTIGKAPTYGSKDGYVLVGFYTNKNADATGKNASFTGTKFVDDETVVTNKGQNDVYYAAWEAKPITATFVTADNQLIGTIEGRYNNYLTNTNMYNGLTNLNANVKAAYKGTAIQFDKNDNSPVYKDGSSSYTFSHWKIIKGYEDAIVDKDHTATLKGDVTFQAVYTKADAKKYSVKFYDGNGNVINDASNKSDYKFRDTVIMPSTEPSKATDNKYSYEFIGWANAIGDKFYAVDENDFDAEGSKIVYTSKDAAEFTVRGDASYVPVFRMIPREYNVTFKYFSDGQTQETLVVPGYHLDDGITLPAEIKDNYTNSGLRFTINGWKVGTSNDKKQLADIKVTGDMTLTATYGAGVGAEYTINFYDFDGNLINEGNNIYTHNATVTVPLVGEGEGYDIPLNIDTDKSLYTFVKFNTKDDGTGSDVSTTAGADADYYAVYSKKDYADVHFYNYDGTLIYSVDGKEKGLFVGDKIPEYANMQEGEDGVAVNVLPSREEDPAGTYNFTGWADKNGVEIVPGTDKFTGDTYLYAQFETVYKEYTVKFLNDDGSIISEKKYHYATEIEVPADATKESDETFDYSFKAWTPDVSEVCYGNATYTATYRRAYKHYTVTWFDDAIKNPVTVKYTYGSKIQQAVASEVPADTNEYGTPAAGYTWQFSHWVQCDAAGNDILVNGKQVIFTRGTKMGTEALYYYPVYKEVANKLTVTFHNENGDFLGTAQVPYGELLAEYDDAFEDAVEKREPNDENTHNVFEKWVKANGGATVTVINEDVTVKPAYKNEEHKMVVVPVKAATCTETGLADSYCSACDYENNNIVIPVLEDNEAPAGQIYVGSNNWTSVDYANGDVDYTDVKFISPDTKLVVNANDNASTPNRGVGKIEYYISDGVIEDFSTVTEGWTTVYDYEKVKDEVLDSILKSKGLTKAYYISLASDISKRDVKAAIDAEVAAILATYRANATGLASNLNLVNGEDYIIYIRISDRDPDYDGNEYRANVTYLSSGTLMYGSKAADITVNGSKFCTEANITITDDTDGFTAYLNGEAVELTFGEDGKSATYVCTKKGLHTFTVIDAHGNKSTETIEIKGGHTYRNYTIAATCENDGSTYDICTVCGTKANEKVINKLGHSFDKNYVEKAATCENDGYRTYVCDNNCGEKLTVTPTEDSTLTHLKKTGHEYKDEWVIDKAATCAEAGSKHRDCEKCGILGRETKEIPADTVNGHKLYRATVSTAPTCTEQGEKTQACRYCDYVKHVEYVDALGHVAGEYEILADATCDTAGSKVLKCGRCEVLIGEADAEGNYNVEAPVTVEIPMLGHAWKTDGVVWKAEADDAEAGIVAGKYYITYICANDNTHVKYEEAEEYQEPVAATVKFNYNGGYVVVKPAVGNVGDTDYVPAEIKTEISIDSNVGETISANMIAGTPVKDADEANTYTFSYWAVKNGDGTYTEVKFPVEVEGDATYYAVYAPKGINYTITYYVDELNADGTGTTRVEYKKDGYKKHGDTVKLAAGPERAKDDVFTYKFIGWASTTDGTVYTDEVTINGANVNLVAKYTEVRRSYAVTFAYSSSNIIQTTAVDAEAKAECAITPVKEHDNKYHYEFKGWNKANQLENVISNIYTTPDFEKAVHDYKKTTVSDATCDTKAEYCYTCEVCGYSYTAFEGVALGHDWNGEAIFNEETGKNTVTCQREGCDETQEDTRTCNATFYVDGKYYKDVNNIEWGSTIAEFRLPVEPVKAATAKESYEFLGWYVKGDSEKKIVDFSTYVIKSNAEFEALFETVVKKYTVTFAYDAEHVIYTVTVDAGATVKYDENVLGKPKKAYDENGHYVFTGWNGYIDEESTGKADLVLEDVTTNLYITAKFKKEDHKDVSSSKLEDATCEHGEGIRYFCSCGYFHDVAGKPLAHNWVEAEKKPATEYEIGYIIYECSNCDATKKEDLIWTPAILTLKVTVLKDGKAQSGVQVEFSENSAAGSSSFETTNANGVATSIGDVGQSYTAYVIINGEAIKVDLVDDGNGNLIGVYSYTTQTVECTCACHRDNIWGAIFRMFHKLIKLFTGEFKCCGDPDPKYG